MAETNQIPLPSMPPQRRAEREARQLTQDAKHGVRIRVAQREQRELVGQTLDDLLPEQHRARDIWAVVENLDLSMLYKRIEARGSNAGASAIDPKISLCLWIYATCEGEGSSHEIARLCTTHNAYRWICGGVTPRQRHLSSFRARSGKLFADLISQCVAVLRMHGLCSLEWVAQDGTRVRASAGAASFKRAETLEGLRKEARAHLKAVLADAQRSGTSAVRRAARERGARERLKRVEAAIAQLPELAATKKRNNDKREARVSTTDPDARVMKRGDGGFRPAYNVQFATTTDETRMIVAVDVSNSGSDQGEAEIMLEQIEDRYGVRPKELLVDGGYLSYDILDALAPETTVYAPLGKPRKNQRPPTEARATDSPATAEWRKRMQTEEAKRIYKQRAASAETPNADEKAHRGLDDVPIRSISKAFAFAALFALSYDILRIISLCRAA